jgi:phosphatidylserine decarboxylase
MLRFNIFHKEQTRRCGIEYTHILKGNHSKHHEIQEEFIAKYQIDMSIYNRTEYWQYASVNDWFTRTLDPATEVNQRPVASPQDDNIVVSPADARLMVFDHIDDELSVWIKGSEFTVRRLLDMSRKDAETFRNGSMAIVRLAPQDYHRFHSPVSGRIVDEHYASGTIFSVSADAMTSRNDAQYNQRVITIIDTGDSRFGKVAMVSIGATCVGSVYMNHHENYVLQKGQEMGFFQFGGSTNVLVFEPGKIVFDEDIRSHSAKKVETLVRMGQQIASRRP